MSRVASLSFIIFSLLTFSNSAKAVINGQFLHGSDFHWVVRVTSAEQSCSGALLNAEWVITAGHCVGEQMAVEVIDYPDNFDFERFQDMDELLAHYGVHQWAEHARDFVLEVQDVEHAYFKRGTDVALLKMKAPFETVKKFASVATEEEAKSLESRSYVELVVAGFGLNGKLGRPLQEAAFGLFKYYYITFLDRQSFRFPISFAGSHVYDTPRGVRPSLNDPDPTPGGGGVAMGAPGDSGGPLLTFLNGEWKIVGVNSMAGGSLRYMKFMILGGDLEMPARMRHVKVNQAFLCGLAQQAGSDLSIPEMPCY